MTRKEKLLLIKNWYLNEIPYILQDEFGRDLEEVVQFEIDSIDNINEIQ